MPHASRFTCPRPPRASSSWCQGSGCEQKARAGRATFAADYSLGPGEAPLLSFDPGNWEAPFAVPEE